MCICLRSLLKKTVSEDIFVTTLFEYYKPKCVGKYDLKCEKGKSDERRMKDSMTEHLVSVPEYEVEKLGYLDPALC